MIQGVGFSIWESSSFPRRSTKVNKQITENKRKTSKTLEINKELT
jgi:hypothetical protein